MLAHILLSILFSVILDLGDAQHTANLRASCLGLRKIEFQTRPHDNETILRKSIDIFPENPYTGIILIEEKNDVWL
jgi:hypothetical protein